MFEYTLIRGERKTLAVQIEENGDVVVKAPKRLAKREINGFLKQKEAWIAQKIQEQQAKFLNKRELLFSEEERRNYIEKAKDTFKAKAEFYAAKMGVSYNTITIREQKTRWGSCSSAKNLNFNWRLLLAPESVLDYVVVHELAHLKELNHSKRFYNIVEQIMPDYKNYQRWLKDHGNELWYEK